MAFFLDDYGVFVRGIFADVLVLLLGGWGWSKGLGVGD
jgi:hypothetical protein